jgi:putative FmdB family regulatory protein
MPIYEYQCAKCGVFEVTQRITENPLKKCPTCKGKVERIISATSFVLKGSGWYATDYAKSGNTTKSETSSDSSGSTAANTNSASSASEGKSESSSTAKTEAPAAKPAAEKPAA